MTAVMLYSGGLDSLLLWRQVPHAIPVHVDYGQPYLFAEEKAIRAQRGALGVSCPHECAIHPYLMEEQGGHVPHRNLALIVTAAAQYPAATRVLIGGVRGEASPDKNRRFLRAASDALSRGRGRRITVEAPLMSHTKAAWLTALVDELGQEQAQVFVNLTTSCYRPVSFGPPEHGCGECQACFRRWVAVNRAGLTATFRKDPAARRVSRREALRHLRGQPLGALPGFAWNQYDAWKALRNPESGIVWSVERP